MASETFPATLNTLVDRSLHISQEESLKANEPDRLPLYTLPEMSSYKTEVDAEVETLRRENRVIKTVMSENEELQAKVIVFEERLKSLSKEPETSR